MRPSEGREKRRSKVRERRDPPGEQQGPRDPGCPRGRAGPGHARTCPPQHLRPTAKQLPELKFLKEAMSQDQAASARPPPGPPRAPGLGGVRVLPPPGGPRGHLRRRLRPGDPTWPSRQIPGKPIDSN
uniref:Proline-rich proteoglycan 2-like n=1 Tax=Castor canadensis TaxID=51338 RepID=A0A8B7VM38_CASCN|nr:proline-rich proteoglycan 2-like [Castor canadensis]